MPTYNISYTFQSQGRTPKEAVQNFEVLLDSDYNVQEIAFNWPRHDKVEEVPMPMRTPAENDALLQGFGATKYRNQIIKIAKAKKGRTN